jgi:trehalose synthase
MPGVSSRVLSSVRYAALLDLIDRASSELQGRVIWNVNSTASGGGVVEPLRPLLGYSRGSGVDARWVVITGEPEFFAVTKRLHNRLHGSRATAGRWAEPSTMSMNTRSPREPSSRSPCCGRRMS